MTFKTPCFVRVKDAAERQKLIEWLKSIGQENCIECYELVFSNKYAGLPFNCGASVDLFRALAAMNNKNDLEQWFVVKKTISDFYDIDDVVYQKGDMFFNDSGQHKLPRDTFRKATVEEIVEYFEKRSDGN